MDLEVLLDKHSALFGDIPPGVPLDRGFEHVIELDDNKLVVITPYHHWFKDEIKRTIHELIDMGHIRPSSSPFSYLVVLVKRKDETM